MAPWIALFALPLTAAMPAPTIAPDLLAAAADVQWVSFERTAGNQIRFPITIDGRPATALLDTGFSQSAISRTWAKNAHLRIDDGERGLGVGGSVAIGQVAGQTLTIGGLTKSGGRLAVIDLPAAATGGDGAVDAVIGADIVRHYALDIDFANRRFRLLPSGQLPFAGATAPLEMRGPLYASELRLGAMRVRPVIIDTGDGSALALSAEAWRALGPARPATTTTIAYSVAGPVQSELAVMPGVTIGDADVGEAAASLEGERGFLAQIGASGRIGIGVLQRFRVLLDPGAGRMVLAPAATGDAAPALRSTSGLLVGVASDRLRVLHVMRGGPAAAGGWRTGEEICRIDGTAITSRYLTDPIARWAIGTPGRVVQLGLCNGPTRALTLARFY
ncbi:MAG: aspartyl protease family protein [Sphingomonas sp.]|uniref:aspartyl protease family protein n=1 Tax=Sphingomonas sp. TaxID=28214 RepID=UPI001AC76957|nr:aspartyl protease family protein [Sphingomonas sp.]MBN8808681.1 aspartyl protease family protein [Sphingomonas sp.]